MSDINELARFISGPGANIVSEIISIEVDDAVTTQLSTAGFISVPLGAITQEDGTVLTKQATTVAGYSQISNKETVIEIPVNCTAGEALGFVVPIPLDLDTDHDLEIHVLVGKGSNLDTLTLDCEVYQVAAGDVGNADIQGTAATTVTQAAVELTFACAAAGLLTPPGAYSVVLTLGGTNDGDAMYIYAVWLEYTKVLLINLG